MKRYVMHRSVARLLVALLVLMAIASCSQKEKTHVLDITVTSTQLYTLRQKYEQMQTINTSSSIAFTEDEKKQLRTVDKSLSLFITKVEGIIVGVVTPVDMDAIAYLWGLSKDSYTLSCTIAKEHWNEFTPDVKTELTTFAKLAKQTDVQIDKIVNRSDYEDLHDAIVLTTNLATIAANVVLAM